MPRGKKECPSCKSLIGVRLESCACGHVFSKKKKAESKISKMSILNRLILVPDKNKRPFYAREMKMLNILCERYSLEFINIVEFGKKFDSFAYISSPKLRNVMDMKWRAFNYKVDKNKYTDYNIGEKVGKDKQVTKRNKTTKDFLNE